MVEYWNFMTRTATSILIFYMTNKRMGYEDNTPLEFRMN